MQENAENFSMVGLEEVFGERLMQYDLLSLQIWICSAATWETLK